jgi:hypothetical protein
VEQDLVCQELAGTTKAKQKPYLRNQSSQSANRRVKRVSPLLVYSVLTGDSNEQLVSLFLLLWLRFSHLEFFNNAKNQSECPRIYAIADSLVNYLDTGGAQKNTQCGAHSESHPNISGPREGAEYMLVASRLARSVWLESRFLEIRVASPAALHDHHYPGMKWLTLVLTLLLAGISHGEASFAHSTVITILEVRDRSLVSIINASRPTITRLRRR